MPFLSLFAHADCFLLFIRWVSRSLLVTILCIFSSTKLASNITRFLFWLTYGQGFSPSKLMLWFLTLLMMTLHFVMPALHVYHMMIGDRSLLLASRHRRRVTTQAPVRHLFDDDFSRHTISPPCRLPRLISFRCFDAFSFWWGGCRQRSRQCVLICHTMRAGAGAGRKRLIFIMPDYFILSLEQNLSRMPPLYRFDATR